MVKLTPDLVDPRNLPWYTQMGMKAAGISSPSESTMCGGWRFTSLGVPFTDNLVYKSIGGVLTQVFHNVVYNLTAHIVQTTLDVQFVIHEEGIVLLDHLL